jgi:hypothetical protein
MSLLFTRSGVACASDPSNTWEECKYHHDLESLIQILLHLLTSFRPFLAEVRGAKGSITRRWEDLKLKELADEEAFFVHRHWYKGWMYSPERDVQRELLT